MPSAPERLLPARLDADPRLLARAAQPGRVRAAVLDTWAAVRAAPLRADSTLRRTLREARHLHSAERRFVADALYALIRHHRLLAASTGADDAVEAWFEAWLRWQSGDGELADALPQIVAGRGPSDALALLGSIDASFAEALLASVDDPIGFLAASNERAPLVLRANRRRGTREQVAERLRAEGLETTPTPLASDGLIAARPLDVNTLAAFRDGWFEVQDEGSQLAGELAAEGAVVDYCAGAGGKALQLGADGRPVLALDVRRSALDELRKRSGRAGLRIGTGLLRGALPDEAIAFAARGVLVDAPCSGSGTLRRHPELRWRIDAALIAEMPRQQQAILEQAASLVPEGGWLVYSTCSVLREENEAVIAAFIDAHPAFRIEGEPLRVAPHTHGTDGFYAVRLRR